MPAFSSTWRPSSCLFSTCTVWSTSTGRGDRATSICSIEAGGTRLCSNPQPMRRCQLSSISSINFLVFSAAESRRFRKLRWSIRLSDGYLPSCWDNVCYFHLSAEFFHKWLWKPGILRAGQGISPDFRVSRYLDLWLGCWLFQNTAVRFNAPSCRSKTTQVVCRVKLIPLPQLFLRTRLWLHHNARFYATVYLWTWDSPVFCRENSS